MKRTHHRVLLAGLLALSLAACSSMPWKSTNSATGASSTGSSTDSGSSTDPGPNGGGSANGQRE